MSSSSSDDLPPREPESDAHGQRPERAEHSQERDPTRAKEKKRVEFATIRHQGVEAQDSERAESSQPRVPPQHRVDQAMHQGSSLRDGNALLSALADMPGNRESFNREELTAALTKILAPELKSPAQPLTRPVLRQHSSYSGPETGTSGPTVQPEMEAKDRADRLASTLDAHVPARLRLNLGGHDTTETSTPFESSTAIPALDNHHGAAATTGYNPAPTNSTGARPRGGTLLHDVAEELVRTHTARKHALSQERTFTSGTATPIPDDLEYVPRPQAYRGGVLGSLLKLYSSEAKSPRSHGDISMPSTPSRTPRHSPPSSVPGTPRLDRPRTGKRPTHHRSQSSTALAELVGSSMMFATPGTSTSEIPSVISEKIKLDREHERERKRKKKRKSNLFRQDEEYRVTVHIAEILSRQTYLLKLCRALMSYGAPTHRLEAYMSMSARVLGIEGQFLYLPGIMIISFDDSSIHTTEVRIVKTVQGLDLGRLHDVHSVYKDVIHDLMSVDDAMERLETIASRKDRIKTWMCVILYGLASALVAPFAFEGRYIDLPIAFILGCIVGLLQLVLAPSNELYANVFEISAAVLTSFLSRMFGSLRGSSLFCFSSLAQSSIAMILPGYMILSSSLELQNHQMVSGSVRMIYALIYTLFLGYGLTIGSIIYGFIDKNAVSAVHCSVGPEWYSHRPPSNYYVLFVFGFTLATCAIYQAKYRQLPIMLFIALAGYLVNNYSSSYFSGNSTLSSSLGALCIGVLANFYSRLGRYVENWCLDIWELHIQPQFQRVARLFQGRSHQDDIEFGNGAAAPPPGETTQSDTEIPAKQRILGRARKIGYGMSAAAMPPAIFVQVPGGLAVSGSLLNGIDQADLLTHNQTILANGTIVTTTMVSPSDLNSTAFNVLESVIQIAISISVGISLSALLVYPLGKRRSGLFSL